MQRDVASFGRQPLVGSAVVLTFLGLIATAQAYSIDEPLEPRPTSDAEKINLHPLVKTNEFKGVTVAMDVYHTLFAPMIISRDLEARGAEIIIVRHSFIDDPEVLNKADVLMMIGPHWTLPLLTDEEIKALKAFVDRGGSLFLAGIAWSWPPYAKIPMEQHPFNRLGKNFGFALGMNVYER